jgi:hypothetical protein
MKKTVVIHQPDFLPYLGFFHRLIHADLFVILDNAQYVNGTSQSWMNRDKLKTSQGERWLTVSVKKAPRDTPINQIELSDNSDWKKNNLNLIRHNYMDAPHFAKIYPHIENLYAYNGNLLYEFNLNSIRMLTALFGIEIPEILVSTLRVEGRKNELLVGILKKVGATQYLSGVGAKAYFEPDPFEKAKIEVVWQNFTHPAYPQLHGPFIPYLSSIDVLFNCGIEESRKILRSS